MELWKQDALTALARFYEDCWNALPADDRGRRMNDVRLAFDLWAEAPSQPAWDNFVSTLEAVTDRQTASSLVGDLEPYWRPKSRSMHLRRDETIQPPRDPDEGETAPASVAQWRQRRSRSDRLTWIRAARSRRRGW